MVDVLAAPPQKPHHDKVFKVGKSRLGIAAGRSVPQEIPKAVERVAKLFHGQGREIAEDGVSVVEQGSEVHWMPFFRVGIPARPGTQEYWTSAQLYSPLSGIRTPGRSTIRRVAIGFFQESMYRYR